MSTYPGSIVSFTTKTNKVDTVDASHMNSVQGEIQAIETALGAKIGGSYTDLNTRLAVCFDTDGALAHSNAFPAIAIEGQMFWRTDEDTLYIYDGASWDNMLSVADNTIGTAKLINTSVTFSKLDDTCNRYSPIFSLQLCGSGADGVGGLVTTSGGNMAYGNIGSVNNLAYYISDSGFLYPIRSKFRKESWMTSLDSYAYVAGGDINSRFSITAGALTATSLVVGTATPHWSNLQLDISSLNNGTIYDLIIGLQNIALSNAVILAT
jgi:hypothetical protein